MGTPHRQGFRERARAWLALAGPVRTARPRLYEYPALCGDRVAIAGSAEFSDGALFEDPLIVAREFHCGSRCRFQHPVYIGGNGEVGRGSQLCAVVAEGALTLGPGSRVACWVESRGTLELRAGCRVGGEAISGTAIRLGLDARASSLFAPEVTTHGRIEGIGEPAPVTSYLEIGPPASGRLPDLSVARGWRPEKMRRFASDTWLYEGHLLLPMPLLLRAKLIVRGSFGCPPGSLLEGDVKAGGSIEVGAASLCCGNLTAFGDLSLDQDCLFAGELRAGGTLRLASGNRGFSQQRPVLASAGGAILLEPDVMVRGRLSSDNAAVVVVAPETATLGLLAADG